jgi:hypothetical protein
MINADGALIERSRQWRRMRGSRPLNVISFARGWIAAERQ